LGEEEIRIDRDIRAYILLSMKTTLQKWGNSQGVRVPKVILDTIGLKVGAEIEIELSDDSSVITIRPSVPSRPVRGRYRIEDLVAGIPRDGENEEISWGEPQGKEVW
jgi:antitoxin MazE